MKNVFIDSNIWLSLYHYTSDDLEKFGQLRELLGSDVNLYITEQVKDEVYRNREIKIKDAFNRFSFSKTQYPTFCRNYEEYNTFDELMQQAKEVFDAWHGKMENDIRNQSLPADKTINEFFEATAIIERNSEMVDRAITRYHIGNPPGKDNKYGDAINWECLLDSVPQGEDIFIISADKDYCSEFDPDKINLFLKNEWSIKKQSEVFLYKTLVDFLKEHFQSIQLEAEQEKEDLVHKLQESHSFEETHAIINKLKEKSDWSNNQIEKLCYAAINNSQVAWIMGDKDVLDFYYNLLFNGSSTDTDSTAIKAVVEKVLELMHQE